MRIEVESPPATPFADALRARWREFRRAGARCLDHPEASRLRLARRHLRLFGVQFVAAASVVDDGRLQPFVGELLRMEGVLGKLRDVQQQRLLVRKLRPRAAARGLHLHLRRRERRSWKRARGCLRMEKHAVRHAVEAIAASEQAHFHFPDRVHEACERSRLEAVRLLANPSSESRSLHRGRIALRRYLHLAAALGTIYPPPAVHAPRLLWNRAACLGQIHDLDKLIRHLKPGRPGSAGKTAPAHVLRACSRRRARLLAKLQGAAAVAAMMHALAGGGPRR